MSTIKEDTNDHSNAGREEPGKEPASDFARRLFSLRLPREGIAAFSRRIKVSRNQLNNWFNEPSPNPKLNTLLAIAKKTNTSIEWLATGEGEMRARPPGAEWQAMRDDIARVVKAVEEAVAGYGWQCGPAEKTEMVLAVSSLVWDRADEGLEPWDFAEIMAELRRVHERHSRKDG